MALSRVLVANRGEIAVRIVRACRDLGIESVAVYSTADRDALHVQLADRAVCIGPPPSSQSYLLPERIIAAAETTGCEAIHPGYGFLSENPDFVRLCAENDLIFVGPSPEVMEVMGDKARAKDTMRAAGLPLVPGSTGLLSGGEEAAAVAADAGYPVLLKAAAGGGGRGMRLVGGPDELADAYRQASQEAEKAFGDGAMYLEKAVVRAHHVEIQVLCDAAGGILICGERECSVQRRHQKLIEESPSPFISDATREAMEAAAEVACRHIDYRNAGTIEFLVGADQAFYFMEMNTRLQVEHPVTETVTGIDLVREQLRIAAGEALRSTGRAPRAGHAIEFRINAEDPSHGFRPSAGRLDRFRAPLGPGVRVDTQAYEGYAVPPFYDSLVAKVIVQGADRAEAIARGRRTLRELEIAGIRTTRELFLDILDEPLFLAGDYTTAYLDDAAERLPSLGEA